MKYGKEKQNIRFTRIAGLLMTLVLSASVLCSCGRASEAHISKAPDRLQIVTTMFAEYDFARAVAGDEADIYMMIKPGTESHSFEPTPKDIISISNCDLFIYVGGENDQWVENVLETIENPAMVNFRLMDCVELYEEEEIEDTDHAHAHDYARPDDHDKETTDGHDKETTDGHDEKTTDGHDEDTIDHHDKEVAYDRHEETTKAHGEEVIDDYHEKNTDEHEDHSEWDEHVWTDPVNGIRIVNKLAEVLAEKDPSNAENYRTNAENYVARLEAVDKGFKELMEERKTDLLVFADRFPARYFTEEYDLQYFAAFPGCAADAEPGAATIARMIDYVRENQVPIIFTVELSNQRLAKIIAEETGAEIATFYTCHNVTREDFEAGLTYADYQEKNLETLRRLFTN